MNKQYNGAYSENIRKFQKITAEQLGFKKPCALSLRIGLQRILDTLDKTTNKKEPLDFNSTLFLALFYYAPHSLVERVKSHRNELRTTLKIFARGYENLCKMEYEGITDEILYTLGQRGAEGNGTERAKYLKHIANPKGTL